MPAPTVAFPKAFLICPIAILVFCSCHSRNDITVIKALDESLSISNARIGISNEEILVFLEKKLQEPSTKEKAMIWYPKAKEISSCSDSIFSYFDEMKRNESFKKENTDDLYKRLIKYKGQLLSIDSSLWYEFSGSIILTTKSFDSIQNEKKDFYSAFFKNASKESSLAMISKLQNNIRVIENKTLAYCDAKVPSGGDSYTTFSVLSTQSTSYVQAGEKIEITAGVGSFSRAAQPEIKINGIKVGLNDMAFARYSFKASNVPGKHYTAITIDFTDPDGKKESITRNVEYTVAKENKNQ